MDCLPRGDELFPRFRVESRGVSAETPRALFFAASQSAAACGRESLLLTLLSRFARSASSAASGASLLHFLAEVGSGSRAFSAAVEAALLRQSPDAPASRPGLAGWTALVSCLTCCQRKISLAKKEFVAMKYVRVHAARLCVARSGPFHSDFASPQKRRRSFNRSVFRGFS